MDRDKVDKNLQCEIKKLQSLIRFDGDPKVIDAGKGEIILARRIVFLDQELAPSGERPWPRAISK